MVDIGIRSAAAHNARALASSARASLEEARARADDLRATTRERVLRGVERADRHRDGKPAAGDDVASSSRGE